MLRDYNLFRVLCIDPGSSTAGFSIIDWDFFNKRGYIVDSNTYTATLAINASGYMPPAYDNKDHRLHGYGIHHADLLRYYEPDVVVSEAPYKGRFAQAFKVLSEVCQTLREATIDTAPHIDFISFSPSTVKNAVGVSGKSSDKDLMTQALAGRTDLTFLNGIDLMQLDEHSVDSICVGLTFIDMITDQRE